jgi:predicted nucleic acid-binding protein
LPEITYLFERDLSYSATVRFLAEFAETEVELVCLTIADIQRAQMIMSTYASSEFDLADACIMALSERLQITQVCTFDRRDFSIFRPAHCAYLELLP